MKLIFSLLFFITISPIFAQLLPVPSGVIHWDTATVKKDGLRESRKLAMGTTPEFEYFGIHATTQQKGALPKASHAQKDIEELIIIKEGKMKAVLGDRIVIIGTGSVLLIPPGQQQQFENVGDGPLSYYVFQFRSKTMNPERSRMAGGTTVLDADSLPLTKTAVKGTKKYFDRATAMCSKYEMHITELYVKGPSHAPHTHIETEIMLIINGTAEMTVDGKTYTAVAGDICIANSNQLHGIGNPSDKPCSYFAFKWKE